MQKTIELLDKKKAGRGYSGYLMCRLCGENFKSTQSRVKRGLGKYCSKKCYGLATTGSKHPGIGEKISKTKKKRGVYVNFECEICDKKIQFSPSHAKGRRTCSRKCCGKLVSERLKKMWQNPPEKMLEKMRAAMIERRSKGRIDKETKPERIFREELERRNIVFEEQYGFGEIMIADFFIPSLQAFIFVDGSYWHGLLSSTEKDWQQVAFVRTKGMKAYRFGEKRVFENVSKCVDEVIEDAYQPFSMADVIDRFTILGIKTQMANGEKLTQSVKDYRRMSKLLISSLSYYKLENPEKILQIMKDLLETNIKIFILVDKVQKDEHTREEAKKLQDLNGYRSQLMNALSEEFKEQKVIKV